MSVLVEPILTNSIAINLMLSGLMIATFLLGTQNNGLAQIDRQLEFRIDSEMYTGGSKLPVSKNKTVFADGLIFDFPVPMNGDNSDEILIYDSHRKAINLLDMKRQIQLSLLDVQVEKLIAGMRDQMQQDDRSKLLLEQTFNERVDLNAKAVTLTGSQNMTYRFFGKPPANAKVLPAYFEFLDIFTRVQASDPKKFPPFARIRLNQSIRNIGWMPDKVEVEIAPSGFFRTAFSAHSTHKLSMELTDRDRAEIALAKKNWAAFPVVSLTEYRSIKTKQGFFARVAKSAKEKDEADKTTK